MANHIEEKIKYLSRCNAFRDLGVSVVRRIAEISEEIEVGSGKHLYFQGEDADHFYLVVSGKVEVRGTEVMTGNEVTSTASTSSLVGYNSHLLAQEAPRQNRSARVATNSRLLKIDEEAVNIIKESKPLVYVEHCAAALREMLSSAPQTEVIQHLRSDAATLTNAKVSVLVAGERVFEEGDLSEDVFFILGGSVKIVKKSIGGREEMIARLRPGQVFGEIGLDVESYRNASVESEGVSTLLRVERSVFKALMRRNPALRDNIRRQSELYSMKDSSGIIARAFRNMNVSSKVAIMTFVSMSAIASAWYSMGSDMLNNNFSARLVNENQQKLNESEEKLAQYLRAIEQVEKRFYSSAQEAALEGSAVKTSAHRSLDVYYIDRKELPLMSIPEFVEERVVEDLRNVIAGESIRKGYQLATKNGMSAFYKVRVIKSSDGGVAGATVAVFDPVDILADPQILLSFPGQDPIMGVFPGRRRDLDRQPENFLKVGPNIFTIAKDEFNVGELGLSAYSWTDVTQTLAQEKELRQGMLFIILVGISVSVVVSYLLAIWAISSLRDLSHSIRRLTEGQRSIPIPFADRSNEIGYIAKDIAVLQDTMQQQEVLASDRMVEQQRKLQRQEEIKTIVQRFEERFDEYIRDFHQSIESFNTVSGQLLDGSSKASESTDKILSAFTETRNSVEKVEKSAFQLRSATRTIEQKTDASQRSLEKAVGDADAASQSIDKLTDSVESIDSILGVIKGIAEKTRLLALNAHIEAAKAGPSGKGFGVVAQEVRNLALQSYIALTDIQQMVTDIQHNSGDVNEALDKIIGTIGTLREEQGSIVEAVTVQSKATHKINMDVGRASLQTKEVSTSMKNISDLVGSSEDIAGDVNASAKIMRDTSDDFEKKISGFLRDIRE